MIIELLSNHKISWFVSVSSVDQLFVSAIGFGK